MHEALTVSNKELVRASIVGSRPAASDGWNSCRAGGLMGLFFPVLKKMVKIMCCYFINFKRSKTAKLKIMKRQMQSRLGHSPQNINTL